MSQSLSHSSLWYLNGALLSQLALSPLGGCNPATTAALQPTPTTNVALAGRFTGVDVIRTSTGGTLIHILGGPVGTGEPLYVVDGAPIMVQPGQGLDWLDPEQITRIEVLKFPTETLMYGPRGANGVVLVTTTGGKWPN